MASYDRLFFRLAPDGDFVRDLALPDKPCFGNVQLLFKRHGKTTQMKCK